MKKLVPILVLLISGNDSFSQSCAIANCPNLVVNGDFSNGNSGFTSSLIYNNVGTLPSFNHYYVSDNAYVVYNNWAAMSPDSSNFMICDGSITPGALVWSQAIPIIQGGMDYSYCMIVTNLDINHSFVAPNLRIVVLDQNNDTLLHQQTGPIIPQNTQFPPVYVWTAHTFPFNALPGSTSCTIQIRQIATASGGNDFGIDDITLYQDNCAAPTGKLNASETNICEGDCIDFQDHSSGGPTTWHWIFPGATPGTSNVQNPSGICYALAGSYSVTLIVSNPFGSDTVEFLNFIQVAPAVPGPEILLNGDFTFGNAAFNTDLTYVTTGLPSPGVFYINTDAYVVFGNWAAVAPDTSNFMIVDGSLSAGDTVWSQYANGISGGSNYVLSFDLTNIDINHTFYNPEFDVTVTDQAGNVALSVYTGGILPQNSQVPPVYVWNPFSYSFTAPAGATSLHVVITQTSGVYLGYDFGLDNISLKGVTCIPTQTEEIISQSGFSVYPNPSSAEFTITTQALKKSVTLVTIINVQGEIITSAQIALQAGKNNISSQQMGIGKLSRGIYFLRLSGKDFSLVRKLFILE